ncbi:MAG: M48 family metallopeptidase [Verrucomicrobiota bacterium JB022]|nr:M48 family metallopeptidase [Verrucomicrobiota bacterium JB022]
MKRSVGLSLCLTAAALALMPGCANVPAFLPEKQLAAQASTQFDQMKQELKQSNNQAYVNMVKEVGNRIAPIAGQDMEVTQWEFVVFDDAAINAFAMPGGKVAVFTGLLDLIEGDKDELAAVMGHEIAHVALRHSNKQMSSEMIRQGGGAALAIILSRQEKAMLDPALVQQAYDLGTQVGLMLPYSRDHELEADALGLYYATKAGYNPDASVELWQKMAAASQSQPAEFLSTHPSHETRIDRLQELIPEVRQQVEAEKAQAALAQ